MKRKLSSTLPGEPLQTIHIGADIVVGNDKGLALSQTASEASEILRELRQLREQRENLNRYEKIARERFLLTYKRDKLHNASDNECRMIERANIKVHGGGALADAELYDDYGRRDYDIFKKLYGLNPKDIGKNIRCYDTIDILNQHATHVAADSRDYTPKFEKLLQKFLEKIEAAK
ncbi:hypothetical protein BDV23DRAFT_178327 [Aspergillus alliaceus]|uniref:Uncharacterized protein n=1 Tax=Petromyces alliaceus TaxID=209559 RepID=A0A5N7CQG1_PETAA|nr:hypothetical protein BDV23DRAFT_178327 [Aspergillus alliaceus]